MSDADITSIDPNLAPGGVVIRVFTDGRLMAERRITDGEEAMVVGVMDREAAGRIAERTIAIHTFDGDSGELRIVHRLFKGPDGWSAHAIYVSAAFAAALQEQRES